MEFQIEYLKCRECENKELCEKCEDFLTEELLLEPEIREVGVQMKRGILSLSSELELSELEEIFRKYAIAVR